MDIEIQIRTGTRRRLESGTIKWDKYKDTSHLVTYSVDDLGAVREALFQAERMLRDSLGISSMQSETPNVGADARTLICNCRKVES